MKTKMRVFALCFSIFLCHAGVIRGQDWASLERFKKENTSLDMPKENESRIVFMGNSITESWLTMVPGFFSGKPYVNRGISGQTTPQMLIRFRQDVIDLLPEAVVILAGTNDIAGNTGPMTLEETFGNIQSMAQLAKANGISVVLASVLPAYDYPWRPGLEPAGKIIRLNEMIRAFARENGMVYLDYFSAMADERNGLEEAYTYDGVHPNEEGYQVMGPLAEEAIEKALQLKK